MSRELLKKVAAALDVVVKSNNTFDALALIPDIQAELARPEVEPAPVGEVVFNYGDEFSVEWDAFAIYKLEEGVKLYASQPDTERRISEALKAANEFRAERDELKKDSAYFRARADDALKQLSKTTVENGDLAAERDALKDKLFDARQALLAEGIRADALQTKLRMAPPGRADALQARIDSGIRVTARQDCRVAFWSEQEFTPNATLILDKEYRYEN